jgi:hypothetical protein
MLLLRLLHGDEGGTKEAYGLDLGMESLSGLPSYVMMWRKSLCARRDGRAGDDGGARTRFSPLGGEGAGVVTRILCESALAPTSPV